MAAARTVAVTGAASGIGAAIARRLAADGWAVTGIDLRPHNADLPPLAGWHMANLADPESAAQAGLALAGTDALVHAAGLMRTGAHDQAAHADGDLMWAVHVRALALLAARMVPAMPVGGRIVAIGSRTSAGAANKGLYAASKAALIGYVRSLAAEVASRGITANIVAPAATATPMLADPDRQGVPPLLPPIGRYVEPAEVAAATAFLLGPEAGAITGQQLIICGGASL